MDTCHPAVTAYPLHFPLPPRLSGFPDPDRFLIASPIPTLDRSGSTPIHNLAKSRCRSVLRKLRALCNLHLVCHVLCPTKCRACHQRDRSIPVSITQLSVANRFQPFKTKSLPAPSQCLLDRVDEPIGKLLHILQIFPLRLARLVELMRQVQSR